MAAICLVGKTFGALGPPVVPFDPFWGRVPLLKQTTKKKCPYSNLSTGGPRSGLRCLPKVACPGVDGLGSDTETRFAVKHHGNAEIVAKERLHSTSGFALFSSYFQSLWAGVDSGANRTASTKAKYDCFFCGCRGQ